MVILERSGMFTGSKSITEFFNTEFRIAINEGIKTSKIEVSDNHKIYKHVSNHSIYEVHYGKNSFDKNQHVETYEGWYIFKVCVYRTR